MVIRTIAFAGILLLAGMVSPATARAQQALAGVDGCAILASVVYREVTQAGLGFSSGPGRDLLYSGRDEITLCNQAARSVTRAFTAALRTANIHVTWGFHTGYGGDYCLSHFLSQCYPRGNPAIPPLSKSEWSFVTRSWQAVHDAVGYRMAHYPGSDVARFQADELGRSIRRSVLAYPGEIESQHYAR